MTGDGALVRVTGEGALVRVTGEGALPRMTAGEGAPLTMTIRGALLRMTTRGRGSLADCHSERPPFLSFRTAVRNLISPSDGLPVTTTVLRVSRHLRFFGVRSSE